MIAKDEETAALGRLATVQKNEKDWDGAINTLRQMQECMWVSDVNYGINEWCRLALLLQQAGRFEESEREFKRLLDDMPKLARKMVFWNDPDVHMGKPGKLAMFNQILETHTEIIKNRQMLSNTREARRVARLKNEECAANPPAVFRSGRNAACSDVDMYIHKCNESIERFDGAEDLVTKFYEMTLLEKNLKALLGIDPDNKQALHLMQMMPEMRCKVEARLIAAQQIQEAKSIDSACMEYSIEIEEAWKRGDYDWARQQLQQIAYRMVGKSVSAEEKQRFTQLVAEFAKEDPLYNEVMARLLPLVQASPGMVQSQIYKGESDEIKEQMRYVLYFAHELGHIRRDKKGNSYKLFPPVMVIDSSTK